MKEKGDVHYCVHRQTQGELCTCRGDSCWVTSEFRNTVVMFVQKVWKNMLKKIMGWILTLRICSTQQKSHVCVVLKTLCLKKPDICGMSPGSSESTPSSKGCSMMGELLVNKPPVPFLAWAGAWGSRRVDPSAKLKLELRFMPSYSATALQCCSHMCCLERVETHSWGHRRKAFPSELICLCKTQPPFPLLFCSQAEGWGGWTMPKRSAVCRSFIIWHA